jgi:hypothetical protein
VEIKNTDSSISGLWPNVVGRIKGKDSGKAAIITAHFDSVGYAGKTYISGAVDNASGIAAMIRVAEILVKTAGTPEIDIVFCAFNGEEQLLIGSPQIVNMLQMEYDEMYNINFDCVGVVGHGGYHLGLISDVSRDLNSGLRQYLNKWGIEYNDEPTPLSDQASFESKGIPNTGFIMIDDALGRLLHTENDRASLLSVEDINKLSEAVAEFLIESGGETYQREQLSSERNMDNAAAWDRAVEEAAGIKENLSLSYDEAYCYITDINGDEYLITVSGNKPLSYEEFIEYYPGVHVNTDIGAFTLDSILVVQLGLPETYAYSRDVAKLSSIVPIGEIFKPSLNFNYGVRLEYKADSGQILRMQTYEMTTRQLLAEGYTQVEGFEHYYCLSNENGDMYGFFYNGGSVLVMFGLHEGTGLYAPSVFVTPEQLQELIELQVIQETLDLYEKLAETGE